MGYVINTNTNAMNAQTSGMITGRSLSSNLSKISSGLRINKAADDASGMAIADSLRSQFTGLTQAIRNANDAIGIIQIADKAMDEQIKILDTVRVKAIQSAQDGQTTSSRQALQSDIVRLLEELDNIATTTSYNGKSLLAGGFSNKQFQIGAYSNETVKASIGASSSDKIGQTRFETGAPITASSDVTLRFKAVDGINDVDLESVIISTSAGTGIGALAEVINKNSNDLRTRAKAKVILTSQKRIQPSPGANTIEKLVINGVTIGTIQDIRSSDSDAKVVAAINNATANTGVRASVNSEGKLVLASIGGRGIKISAEKGLDVIGIPGAKSGKSEYEYYGRLTLIRNDATDIMISKLDKSGKEGKAGSIGYGTGKFAPAESIINLRAVRGQYTVNQASAMGAHTSKFSIEYMQSKKNGIIPTGVTTFVGSQAVIDIADSAIRMLDKVRADLGSVQIQLEATINNITVTRTNVKFSESQIRDVDYASELSDFKKTNIIAQAGNYALSQSNQVQQNVLKLLQ